jgi:hypothetical protein
MFKIFFKKNFSIFKCVSSKKKFFKNDEQKGLTKECLKKLKFLKKHKIKFIKFIGFNIYLIIFTYELIVN